MNKCIKKKKKQFIKTHDYKWRKKGKKSGIYYNAPLTIGQDFCTGVMDIKFKKNT